jgi:ArsR family transcriptional regulator
MGKKKKQEKAKKRKDKEEKLLKTQKTEKTEKEPKTKKAPKAAKSEQTLKAEKTETEPKAAKKPKAEKADKTSLTAKQLKSPGKAAVQETAAVQEAEAKERECSAELFRALGDESRLKILDLLLDGELCAADLLKSLSIVQSTLSHHMKILVEAGLVRCRRQGKWSYYSIDKEMLKKASIYIMKWS